MVQNVAILIGVPNSGSSSFDALPACSRDIEEMGQLISATRRFNQVDKLVDVTSSEVQAKLRSLRDQTEQIGEIFLYFTGHGHNDSSEFYWVTKGFNLDSPRSTGVSQEALFEILREIDATNTVIVQDACFSGQAFFKGERADRLPPLTNLVKFSSSAANAETPAGVALSPFTDHFIEAASTAKAEGSINYLEVTQKLNDLLAQNRMEPHLGYQGTFKQIFCDDATYLQEIRSKYEVSEPVGDTMDFESEPPAPLADDKSVLADASKKIHKQSEIQTLIDTGISLIENRVSERTGITEYYDLSSVKHSDYAHATNVEQLCKIYKSLPKWDDFVTARNEKTKVRQMRSAFSGILDSLYEPEYNVVYDFALNASLENVHQIYHLNPKFDVLRRRELEILYVPGVFHVYFLWRFNAQGLSDWDTFSNKRLQKSWSYKEVSVGEEGTGRSDIIDKFLTDSEATIATTVRNLKAL